MTADDKPECTCPLIDISDLRTGGKPEFVLGDPRGSGCPIHETEEMRNERKDAERRARYGERASGGLIDPGRVYRIGEDGPAPLVVPEHADVNGSKVQFRINLEPDEELMRLMRRVIREQEPGTVVQEALGTRTELKPAPVYTGWVTLETFKVSGWRVLAIVLTVAAASVLITYAAMTLGS